MNNIYTSDTSQYAINELAGVQYIGKTEKKAMISAQALIERLTSDFMDISVQVIQVERSTGHIKVAMTSVFSMSALWATHTIASFPVIISPNDYFCMQINCGKAGHTIKISPWSTYISIQEVI
jgi:hypothetical protein